MLIRAVATERLFAIARSQVDKQFDGRIAQTELAPALHF